jgi:Isochorismatase family
MATPKNLVKRLNLGAAILFICDVQTKLHPLIFRAPSILSRCVLLNNAANELNVPVIVTEQYPKAFGPTVPELNLVSTGSVPTKVFSKRKFSMLTDEVLTELKASNKNQVHFLHYMIRFQKNRHTYPTSYHPSIVII